MREETGCVRGLRLNEREKVVGKRRKKSILWWAASCRAWQKQRALIERLNRRRWIRPYSANSATPALLLP